MRKNKKEEQISKSDDKENKRYIHEERKAKESKKESKMKEVWEKERKRII